MHRLPFTGTVVVSIGCVVDDISEGLVSSGVVGLGVAVWGSRGATICEKITSLNVPLYVFLSCGPSEINKRKTERDRTYPTTSRHLRIIFCACVSPVTYIIRLCSYFKETFYYSLFVASDLQMATWISFFFLIAALTTCWQFDFQHMQKKLPQDCHWHLQPSGHLDLNMQNKKIQTST